MMCVLLAVLAQRGYFRKPEFVHYLSYLQYWKRQEYAKFLKYGTVQPHNVTAMHPHGVFLPHRYPQCLHFLDLLQEEPFRKEVANAQCVKFIEEQQLLHWHHYTKKRSLLSQQYQKKGKYLSEYRSFQQLCGSVSLLTALSASVFMMTSSLGRRGLDTLGQCSLCAAAVVQHSWVHGVIVNWF